MKLLRKVYDTIALLNVEWVIADCIKMIVEPVKMETRYNCGC